MKNNFKNLFKQILSFLLVSGIGWILDFSTYFILTKLCGLNVMLSNMISAVPALTYVFIVSSKNIFKNDKSKIPLKYKYVIYFIYQIILVTTVSFIGEKLFDWFKTITLISIIKNNLKIFVKIIITPITMTLNFITMKNLIEKL